MRSPLLTNGLLWAWLAIALAAGFLVWLLSPSWAVRASALVLSLLLLPVFVTLIYDRRS